MKEGANGRQRHARQVTHLHLVIDSALRDAIDAHARMLEPRATTPNMSAAARDLLRLALGLPRAEAA